MDDDEGTKAKMTKKKKKRVHFSFSLGSFRDENTLRPSRKSLKFTFSSWSVSNNEITRGASGFTASSNHNKHIIIIIITIWEGKTIPHKTENQNRKQIINKTTTERRAEHKRGIFRNSSLEIIPVPVESNFRNRLYNFLISFWSTTKIPNQHTRKKLETVSDRASRKKATSKGRGGERVLRSTHPTHTHEMLPTPPQHQPRKKKKRENRIESKTATSSKNGDEEDGDLTGSCFLQLLDIIHS